MSEPAFRIGVDARVLLDPPCGIRRYFLSLIRSLLKVNDSVEYVLFTTSSIPEEDLVRHERVKQVRVPGFHTALLRPWWESVRLPKAIGEANVDLFFSPLGTVPPKLDIPVVVTVHDLAFKFFPHIQPWKYRQYWNRTMRKISRADAAIAVSHCTKADMKRLDIFDPERTYVVWEGVNHSLFKPAAQTEIDAVRQKYSLRGEFVLFVGTREPRKNLRMLMQCMETVNFKRNRQVPLVLVGCAGWGRKDTEKKLPWLKVLGRVTDQELAALYSCATLFAFPSLYEGFGLPVVEAMSCGAPVVCSDVSSMPEIAEKVGLLLPPNDVHQWADWIYKLLEDESLLTEMREKGIQHSQLFSWKKAASETLEVFFKTIYLANE